MLQVHIARGCVAMSETASECRCGCKLGTPKHRDHRRAPSRATSGEDADGNVGVETELQAALLEALAAVPGERERNGVDCGGRRRDAPQRPIATLATEARRHEQRAQPKSTERRTCVVEPGASEGDNGAATLRTRARRQRDHRRVMVHHATPLNHRRSLQPAAGRQAHFVANRPILRNSS